MVAPPPRLFFASSSNHASKIILESFSLEVTLREHASTSGPVPREGEEGMREKKWRDWRSACVWRAYAREGVMPGVARE